jgi:diguanylate cyclase (GGDEF)-like protein
MVESSIKAAATPQTVELGLWEINLATNQSLRTLQHDQIFGYSTLAPQWNYEIFLNHVHEQDRKMMARVLKQALAKQDDWYTECRIVRIDQKTRWIGMKGSFIKEETGKSIRLLIAIVEITEKKTIEADLEQAKVEIEHSQYFDKLTGLVNRAHFSHCLKNSVTHAEQARDKPKIAVLLLDLDNFTFINNIHGLNGGDCVLQILTKKFATHIKDKGMIARMGADEFGFILKIKHLSEVPEIAKKILQILKEPITLDSHKLFIAASIGISVYPENGKTEHELINHANIAMRHVKYHGGNHFKLCTDEIIDDLQNKIYLLEHLRYAIKNQKLFLNFQPQIDLESGMMTGAETLIRMTGTEGNLLFPEQIMRLAEEANLIKSIDEWLLYNACMQYKLWQENAFTNTGVMPLKLSLNISAGRFKDAGFIDSLVTILEETQLDPHYLELEIIENPIITDIEYAAKILKQLKQIGFSIAIDDFGGEYSSLNYLRHFTIDTLKIHGLLIQNMLKNPVDHHIIKHLIDMSHALGISVIAEEVETAAQLAILKRHHCDKIQGHYFSQALSAAGMTALIIENKRWICENINRGER